MRPGARLHRGHAVRQGLHLALLRHRRRAHGGRPRGRLRPARTRARSPPSPTCCRCWRRSCRPASRCSSSPRTSTARRCPRSSSTRSAAPSPPSPSRRRASATAARRCWRTSRAHRRAGRQPRGRPQARPGRPRGARHRPPRSSSPRTTPRSSRAAATPTPWPTASRQIRAEIENTDSDWDREKLQERLAKLAGGVCVIKVGAATEVELKEKKHRIEDAVSATRAAIEEGIVAGGGSALVHAAPVLDDDLGLTGDEATGVDDRAQGRRRAAALDRRERRPRGLRRRREGARRCRPGTASTPPPASTATSSRRASSTRSR